VPATLIHPAAVLPLYYAARKYLPLSALVIGSLSPDFEYLYQWGAGNRFAHTLAGMAFCLPAGLAALWIFHALVKRPLLEILPTALRGRLVAPSGAFRWLPWTRLPLIVLAVALGALTHMAWDSFTHYGGWSVQHFHELERVLFSIGTLKDVRVYGLLQYVGTLVGFAVLAGCFWLWLRHAPLPGELPPLVLGRRARLWIRAGLVLVPLALGLAVGFTARDGHTGAYGLRQLVAGTALGFHAGLYAAALAYGTGFTLWQWRRSALGNKMPAGGEERTS
jgi:hypothetical protein